MTEKIEKVTIEGVKLILSKPAEVDLEWVGTSLKAKSTFSKSALTQKKESPSAERVKRP